MKFKKSAFLILCVAALTIGWAVQPITFPLSHNENGVELPLRASVHKRAFLVKALAAGIYFADGKTEEDFLKDVPKRLDVIFFIHVHQHDLAGYVRGKIWDNVSRKEFANMEDRLKLMAQYLVAIEPGDRYSVTYTPGVGTRFEHNGKLMGTIEGEDFARGLFSVWVGKHPMDKILKHQILQKFAEDSRKNSVKK